MLRVSEADVKGHLPFSKAIELVREAYVKRARREVANPDRVWLSVPEGASMFFMPAHVYGHKNAVVKVVRENPANSKISLPTVLLTLYVYDAVSGVQVAEVEGNWLTAVRTAASTAVATDLLAKKNARFLGVFGSGVEASAHIPALGLVRDFERVLVYSRDRKKLERFARDVSRDQGMSVVAADSPESVAGESDVIVTATTSHIPVFDGSLVRKGSHVNAIGNSFPHAREVDTALVRRSSVVVDSRVQALATYGDLITPLGEGAIRDSEILELGDVLIGESNAKSDSELTLFKSGGLAVLDAMIADYVVRSVSR